MKSLLARIWPPYELYMAERAKPADTTAADAWSRAMDKSSAATAALPQEALIAGETLAASVFESEIKRKEVLESKASTFVVTPAIATAITAAIAPLTKDLQLNDTVGDVWM